MRLMNVVLVVVVACWPAQRERFPDLSGTWVVDVAKTTAATGVTPQPDLKLVLRQDSTTLLRELPGRDGPVIYKYRLDGQPAEITQGAVAGTATVKQEGQALVIITTRNGARGPVVSQTSYSLDGEWLVVTVEPTMGMPRVKHYYKRVAGKDTRARSEQPDRRTVRDTGYAISGAQVLD
jgi:hypothetical protein